MSIWNKYDKGDIIGHGKNGNIYKCQNKYTKNYVAIKEILKNKTNGNYLKKTEIMKTIENDNSVILIETFDTKDYFYIVMELCICNLEECIQMREKGLSINEIKELLNQINYSLKLLNEKKINHKNLKPSNILISLNKIDNCLIKLSKFYTMSDDDFCLTMAPEIINKEKDLTKSDLWSIGIIIYYLYFKQYPFNGKNESELINDIYSDKLLNKIDNEELDDLMNKLLKKNINERISWDEYFNHPFFKIEEKEKEKDLIHLPLFKTSTYILKNHNKWVYCLTLLNDGRLVSGSDDNSIIIYNKKNYEPDIIINEHNSWINCLITLKNGILVSCSNDKTIKLFYIIENKYEVIQTLDLHIQPVNTIRELSNNYLVSGSDDKTIIFYIKNNEKYEEDYSINTLDWVRNIIQTKENEIAYSTYNQKKIYFYDLNEKRIISIIDDIICCHNSLLMITKDLLLVPGINMINIINIKVHKKIKQIDIEHGGRIYGVCMLNYNTIITGGEYGILRKWIIKEDNLNLKAESEKKEGDCIFMILNMKNGHFAACYENNTIKIW